LGRDFLKGPSWTFIPQCHDMRPRFFENFEDRVVVFRKLSKRFYRVKTKIIANRRSCQAERNDVYLSSGEESQKIIETFAPSIGDASQ
jgi:hypothetical protein